MRSTSRVILARCSLSLSSRVPHRGTNGGSARSFYARRTEFGPCRLTTQSPHETYRACEPAGTGSHHSRTTMQRSSEPLRPAESGSIVPPTSPCNSASPRSSPGSNNPFGPIYISVHIAYGCRR